MQTLQFCEKRLVALQTPEDNQQSNVINTNAFSSSAVQCSQQLIFSKTTEHNFQQFSQFNTELYIDYSMYYPTY